MEKLRTKTVAVIGLGATGSVIAEHLARHGVNLKIVDRDYLESKDLYTSNIYTRQQVEKSLPKAAAAEERLGKITDVEAEIASLRPGNIDILDGSDLLMDGTDNLDTRFLINEYSKREEKPWIYTAAIGKKGYSMLFDESCFNCVFEKVPAGKLETCENSGILREISSMAASRSAWKAVENLAGREVDEKLELSPSGEKLEVDHPGCKTCEDSDFPHLRSNRKVSAVCGEKKYQIRREIDEKGLERLKQTGDVRAENDFLVRAKVDGRDFTAFRSGRAIVEAKDRGHAEAVFSEILGL